MMATGSPHHNRLAQAVSPYLLAHSHQEVDWYPWGEEAFAEAARRDVPLLISIGYRTCHWCHVMSRESFDDPEVAALLNAHCVAIKVDREEHGDVDATYLTQAAAFTSNLGWPLTVFATPTGQAFYAATYLPPSPRDSLPSFTQVIEAVSTAWRDNRDEVLRSASGLIEALAAAREEIRHQEHPTPSRADLAQVSEQIIASEDPLHGGIGSAPKFPMAPVMNFLLSQGELGHTASRDCVERTLGTYANSALFDAVEGGFFRYSTQADFTEPHYERMLYDNAGLLLAYSRRGDVDTAGKIVSFLTHHLAVGGAYASGQDSESIIDGISSEGGYYLRDEQGRTGLTPPALDDKILTGWNGLALEALAAAHRRGVPGNPGEKASALATWLLDHHFRDGSLLRLSRAGVASDAPATLEDYGGLALGLLEAGCALGRADFLHQAAVILNTALERESTLGDPLLMSHGLSQPGIPPGDLSEGASPSGPSLMALALLRWSHLSSQPHLKERALAMVAPYFPQALTQPLAMGSVLRFLAEFLAPVRELIVVGDTGSELAGLAARWNPPGSVSLTLTPLQATEFVAVGVPLLEGRTQATTPTAYLCEAGTCALPVTSAEILASQLTQ